MTVYSRDTRPQRSLILARLMSETSVSVCWKVSKVHQVFLMKEGKISQERFSGLNQPLVKPLRHIRLPVFIN